MTDKDKESVEERIERDAYALAQLIYDIYKEKHRNDDNINVAK